ncbi:MAG: VWA domain-containing protein [Reyranellaceae bacterium]
MCSKFLIVLLLALGTLAVPGLASAQSNVLFIFDASGSMKVAVGGQPRIDIAKRAMSQALKDMPSSTRLGLLMYGHRRARDCSDIELVAPIGADDAAKIDRTIQATQPRGETPIAEALTQAARNFAALKGQTNRIVLITDGIEECRGDPCKAARDIKAAGLDLKVHVVGFALDDAKVKAVQCIANETGGRMLDARDSAGLGRALAEVRQEVSQAPPPPPAQPLAPPGNLLHERNGGRVVWGPDISWGALIAKEEPPKGDREVLYTHALPSEVVFGFKDGQAATFDRFTVYIPKVYDRNLKEFELLAADEPFGEFRSLGRFETKNVRLLRQPYQEFAVPETTARFVKFRVVSTHGGRPLYLYAVQLLGKLDGKPVPAAPIGPKPGQVNLLAAAQGGAVVASPFPEWEKIVSVPETYTGTDSVTYTHNLPSEAILSFKDGRAATFDKLAILVPQTYGRNPKTLELLAADELGGEFRSLGQFTTRNTRIFASPYQEFDLPPTTARFVKLRLIDVHGEKPLYIYPVKLYGTLGAAGQAATAPGPKPGQINLLSKANGGALLAAPFAGWEKVIERPEEYVGIDSVDYTHQVPSEAVFGFRGDRAATFDKFAILVPQSYDRNPRRIEILAGDDLGGEFRSLGLFETQNIRFKASPYQEFALPETTARYLKVRLVETHGGRPLYLYPIKLFGKPAEGGAQVAAAAATPAPAAGVDLIHASRGGAMLVGPDAGWEKLTQRNPEDTRPDGSQYTHRLPLELIYAFKDEKPAEITAVRILIPSAYGRNVKRFEVLAGDDISGEFRSLGLFQTQNLRLQRTPYQEFALPPTTARYVKFRLLDTHGEMPMYVYPQQVIGTLK